MYRAGIDVKMALVPTPRLFFRTPNPKQSEFLPGAEDIVDIPHDDQGHVRFENEGTGRPELEFAVFAANAQQQKVEIVPEAGLQERFTASQLIGGTGLS